MADVAAARSPARSRRARSSTGPPTSAPTSSAALDGGERVRAARGEPDDRVPRLLSATSASPSCSSWSWRRWPGCARRRRNLHVMIPFVRTRGSSRRASRSSTRSPLGRQRGLQALGHGRGALGRLPHPRVRGARHRRRVDRLQRPDPARCSASIATPRCCAELFDEADAAVLDAIRRIIAARRDARHHLVAVRPGALQPARVRRAPGAPRHHLDLGQPRRGGAHPGGDGRGRAAPAAGRGRAWPAVGRPCQKTAS